MTRFAAGGILAIGTCGVLAAVLIAAAVYERPVTRHENRAAAERAGAFAQGWLPASMPAGATDVWEAEDLDSNASWTAFRAPGAEMRQMAAALRPLSFAEMRRSRPRPPWRMRVRWPAETDTWLWTTPRAGIGYFRDPASRYCFAIDWKQEQAFGWSCGSVGLR